MNGNTDNGIPPFPARKRRPGGTRCRSKRLRKKRRKYTETMAAILASIMKHPSGQWSREEKLRLKLVCKDVFGTRCSFGLSRQRR